MNELYLYLKQILNIEIKPVPMKKELTNKLPLYISSLYHLWEITLLGQTVGLAEAKDGTHPTPNQLLLQQTLIRQKTNLPLIFVFRQLPSYNIPRLIRKRVNFIIPGKQMFAPALMLDLRKTPKTLEKPTEKITPTAQLILLYHLQRESLEKQTTEQIAQKLQSTYITTNRAIKSLVAPGLCSLSDGKEKTVHFDGNNKKLWEKSLPYLLNPVKRIAYTDNDITHDKVTFSNLNALAYYSDLNPEKKKYYAFSLPDFQKLNVSFGQFQGDNTIEIWWYDPRCLTDNEYIDKLSLYLLLKDHTDERIQIELQKIIQDFQWLSE